MSFHPNEPPAYRLVPGIAVDASGNMSVVGDYNSNYPYYYYYGDSDFPVTISNGNPDYAFLAKIGPATLPFTWPTPTSITFTNQPVE